MLTTGIGAFWCVIDFLQTYNGAVTAVATAFIAIFTVVLASVTGRQARLARESIALARDEFLASHRPELKIHSIRILDSDQSVSPDAQPVTVEFGIINAGTSAAHVTGSAVYLQYLWDEDRPYLPDLATNDLIVPQRYDVGATNTCKVSTDRWGGLNRVNEENPKTLYLSGWVVYGDGSGRARTTFFCRQCEPDQTSFTLVSDPDCNWTY